MKKRSILTAICALCSVFAIGSFGGCALLEGMLGGSSASESSVKVESPVSSEKEEASTSDVSEEPESSTPETSEEPESSTPETSETPEEKPETQNLSVITSGEVFPYLDSIKGYLQAGAGARVGDYHQAVNSQWAPVQIEWRWNTTGARKFLVEYATKADYSDAISVEAGATKRAVEVYNLYKGTNYYVRISALNGKGEAIETQEGEFYTTDLGPRFMKVDDVRNVRDLGGYTTKDGKTLAQGIAYRGGGLSIPPKGGQTNQISDEGKAYMSEVMGIKSEIDFRTASESGITVEQGSLIPGASLNYITINGYSDIFKEGWYDDEMLQFFTMLSDENNYPFYIHCTGGADRTGTIIYLLHTFLGVSELECLQGFELTSFSSYGLRDTQGNYKSYWDPFMEKLNSFAGDTKQEKVETWMKTEVGVSQEQMDKIKAIFYGEVEVESYTYTPTVSARKAEKKTLNEQYSDLLAAWAVQKKED